MFKKKVKEAACAATVANSLSGILGTFTSCISRLEALKSEASSLITANTATIESLTAENEDLNGSIERADNIINNINKIIA